MPQTEGRGQGANPALADPESSCGHAQCGAGGTIRGRPESSEERGPGRGRDVAGTSGEGEGQKHPEDPTEEGGADRAEAGAGRPAAPSPGRWGGGGGAGWQAQGANGFLWEGSAAPSEKVAGEGGRGEAPSLLGAHVSVVTVTRSP